jgi:hypothetical protein
MTDFEGSIPVGMISFRDALGAVYRTITPDWQILEERLKTSSPSYEALQKQDARDDANREAWRGYDQAQRHAIELLRYKISQGVLVALVRDPRTGNILQLDRDEWASKSDFEMEITIVQGARRPVFFDPKNFENVLAEIAQPKTGIDTPLATDALPATEMPPVTDMSPVTETPTGIETFPVTETPPMKDKGGRLPKYDWDAMKAFALQTIKELGRPHRNNKKLRTKARMIELLLTEWSDRHNQHPPPSSVRWHLNQWLAEIGEN